MSMPTDIGVIDLMLNIPGEDTDKFYDWMKPAADGPGKP